MSKIILVVNSAYPLFRMTNRPFILLALGLFIQCSSPDSPQNEGPEKCLAASFHLNYGSFGFDVEAIGEGSLQQVEIRLRGFPDSVSNIILNTEPVTGADAGDMNGDGYPEILVYTQSAGSGSYGGVNAWTFSQDKGFRTIVLPDLSDDSLLSNGYMGHDRFQLDGTRLMRRFPIYAEGSTNAEPMDSARTIFYSYHYDEQTPRFRIDGATAD